MLLPDLLNHDLSFSPHLVPGTQIQFSQQLKESSWGGGRNWTCISCATAAGSDDCTWYRRITQILFCFSLFKGVGMGGKAIYLKLILCLRARKASVCDSSWCPGHRNHPGKRRVQLRGNLAHQNQVGFSSLCGWTSLDAGRRKMAGIRIKGWESPAVTACSQYRGHHSWGLLIHPIQWSSDSAKGSITPSAPG